MENLSQKLEKICQKYNCTYANLYKVGEKYHNKSQLWCEAGKDFFAANDKTKFFQAESSHYPFYLGSGLPGKVWESGKVEWFRNVQQLDRKQFPRRDIAIVAELKACTGIPYIVDGAFKGVVEFCFPQSKYEDKDFVEHIKEEFSHKD